MYGALYKSAARPRELKTRKPGEARAFFEQNFRPVRISPLGDARRLHHRLLRADRRGRARAQADGYDHPLYRKPASLSAGRMVVASAAAQKRGKKKGRKRRSVPFYDRAAIDDGALAGRNLEICWLKDPIDSFFIHIQGSVRVRLDDGKMLRLNYAAANGHPYFAVGKFLIDRNIVSKDEMSMDRIREWMERNPEEGKELRRTNKSYVFFRETHLASNEEPIGAQGISLTPGRSIAVDRKLHVYGTPFFISAMLPIDSEQQTTPFRRLMIAQDTGGAIVGPARADIYFGAGDEAGSVSGRLRHDGRFVMLVPNELMGGAPEEVPLPRPKPPIAMAAKPEQPAVTASAKPEAKKLEAKKPEAKKPEAKKPEAKSCEARVCDTRKSTPRRRRGNPQTRRPQPKRPKPRSRG